MAKWHSTHPQPHPRAPIMRGQSTTQPYMTNFQSIISDAQQSNLERIKSGATLAVTLFISSAAHGYVATYRLIEAVTFVSCDWTANFVKKIYDMTH